MKQELNNNIEINKKNKDYVGADDPVRPILKRNTQKGITLVALVITIIVLLILAMVSIKIAIDGGLITKSNEAVTTYDEAKIKESIQLAVAQCYMEKDGLTKNNLKQALKEQEIDVEEDNINLEDKTVTINGKEYSLTNEERKWYELTQQEENTILQLMEKDNQGSGSNEFQGDLCIALKGQLGPEMQNAIMITFSKNKKLSGIVIGNLNTGVLTCYFTDEIYNTRGGDLDEIKETYKCYNYGGSGFEQLDPYTGDCPVTISDFDNIVNGCEDFVQRIINSF